MAVHLGPVQTVRANLHHDGALVHEHTAPAPGEGWVGMWRVAGKAAAGRELDGATFNDMPRSTL